MALTVRAVELGRGPWAAPGWPARPPYLAFRLRFQRTPRRRPGALSAGRRTSRADRAHRCRRARILANLASALGQAGDFEGGGRGPLSKHVCCLKDLNEPTWVARRVFNWPRSTTWGTRGIGRPAPNRLGPCGPRCVSEVLIGSWARAASGSAGRILEAAQLGIAASRWRVAGS